MKEHLMRWTMLFVGAALPWAPPLAGQSPPLDSMAIAAIQRVLKLPQTTAEAREAGVLDSAIRVVLGEARRRGVPAGDAQEAVEVEVEAVKAGAPKENFGAFVQAQLAAGKRGRELAAAIRAEHAKQGHAPRGAGAAGAHQHGGPPEAKLPGGPRGRGQMLDSTERVKPDSAAKRSGGRQ
jgi:hypothetical protein